MSDIETNNAVESKGGCAKGCCCNGACVINSPDKNKEQECDCKKKYSYGGDGGCGRKS